MYTPRHGTSSRSETGSIEARAASHRSGATFNERAQRSRGGATGRGASPVGEPLGQAVGRRGTPGLEASAPRRATAAAFGRRPPTHCRGVEARAGSPRIRRPSLDRLARGGPDRTRVWGQVLDSACLASAARLRVDAAATGESGAGARRSGHPPLEEGALAGAKKNAQRQGQTIVFVDEAD